MKEYRNGLEMNNMDKITLMMNGVGIMTIENGKYYKTNEEWECYEECSRNEFIEELKKFSWVCLTSWNKDLREEYLKLVDYCEEIGE